MSTNFSYQNSERIDVSHPREYHAFSTANQDKSILESQDFGLSSIVLSGIKTLTSSKVPSLSGTNDSSKDSSVGTDVGITALDISNMYLLENERIRRFLQDEGPLLWFKRFWAKEARYQWPWKRDGIYMGRDSPVRIDLQSEPLKDAPPFDYGKSDHLSTYVPVEGQEDIIAFPARAPVPGENKPYDLATGRPTTKPRRITRRKTNKTNGSQTKISEEPSSISEGNQPRRPGPPSAYESPLHCSHTSSPYVSCQSPLLQPSLPTSSSEQISTPILPSFDSEKRMPHDFEVEPTCATTHTDLPIATSTGWDSLHGINPSCISKPSPHDPFACTITSVQQAAVPDSNSNKIAFQVSVQKGCSHPQYDSESSLPSLTYDSSSAPAVDTPIEEFSIQEGSSVPEPLSHSPSLQAWKSSTPAITEELALTPLVPQSEHNDPFPFSDFLDLENTFEELVDHPK